LQVRSNDEEQKEASGKFDGDDPVPEAYYPGWSPFSPMSTALVYFLCREGFVIAADGRNTLVSSKERVVTSDEAQKIFPLSGVGMELAMTFRGRTTLYDPSDEYIAFNFPIEFVNAAKAIGSVPFADGNTLLSNLCGLVSGKVRTAQDQIGFSPLPTRRKSESYPFLAVWVDGYIEGVPYRGGITFSHVDQRIGWAIDPEHSLIRPSRYWSAFYGSDTIGGLLFDSKDQRLSPYRTAGVERIADEVRKLQPTLAMEDAIEAALNYVRACSDPDLRQIDPDNCGGIGGHIHIATITPNDGFQWHIPSKGLR
jgi:hypothetical protein